MSILQIILTVLSLSTLFFSWVRPKIGALCFLIYMYLAPYLYIKIGGTPLIIYSRTTAIIFLLAFLIKFNKRIKKRAFRPFKPYICFLFLQMLLLPTSDVMDTSVNQWFTYVASMFFSIFLMANIYNDRKSVGLFKWGLFAIFSIITLYGLFLTLIPGINPYKMLELPLFSQEFNEAYAAGNSGLSTNTSMAEGRMFGRISSFFDHPMQYGLNLGFFFIYSFYIFRNKKWLLAIVLAIIIIASITSGVRSPIAALVITIIFILIYLKNYKYVYYSIIFLGLFLLAMPLLPSGTSQFLLSIIDKDSTDVGGSSTEMRLEQLNGCFAIVKDNVLFGKGLSWHIWYNTKFGGHPVVLFFESIIFTILVETGITGFIIWGIFIYLYYKFAIRTIKDDMLKTTILALLFYYLVYGVITGDFGIHYMNIFFAIMFGFTRTKMKTRIRKKLKPSTQWEKKSAC